MRATRLTFVRVARQHTPATAVLRLGVDEVSPFLVAHTEQLQKRAGEGSAANASFMAAADAQLMCDIREGNDGAFLVAADALSARLAEEMNHVGNPASGLFVCTTLVSDADPAETYAVLLKLEVVSEQGAVLRRLETGEETLAAVTDVLDRPGDLQKGLVFPDARSGSDAVVGDKATQLEAKYFLRAMGVTLETHEPKTAAALVAAVASCAGPTVAERVVDALPALEPAPTQDVLTALRRVVPELTEEASADVERELAAAERPVVRVDTRAPLRGRLRAGALRLSGPAADMRRVVWDTSPEGGWLVSFPSDQEPEMTWS